MTISKKTLLKLLGDRPIAYHPTLARALNGVIEAVFVSQLLYWYDKGKLEDNWIWKTQAEWTTETGLTRSNQETARRNLIKLGILKEKRKGVPGKMHFQLDLDKLSDLLTMLDSDIVETQQSTMPGRDNVDCDDSTINNAEIPPCIPETTTETIPETTTGGAGAKNAPPTRDYLTDVFEGKMNGLQPGVADPAEDLEHYMQTADEWIKVYRKRTGLWPETNVQKPAILELVARPGADLDLWDKVVTSWVKHGWNKTNVAGMIECYERGEIPSTGKNGGSSAHSPNASRVRGRVPAYSVADPAAFGKQRPNDDGA